MKKHLLFLFAALLPLVASAQTKVEIDGIWYNLITKAKQAEVTYKGDSYYSNEYFGSITIPATVTYDGVAYSVTSIGERAFYWCENLTAITIPESVTSIGEYAFFNCSSLTAINIPEGVTSIGDDAFSGCSNLTTITIPEGVTSIGGGAFYECSSLTAINIPESVTSIGNATFYGCSSLTAITIPESVTSIGNSTFYNCSSLTTITIPEGVTSIGDDAFSGCSSLTDINIPENSQLTSIGDDAFAGCTSLTAITIPEGVTSIGRYAFERCSSLTAVHISSIEAWCKISFDVYDPNPLAYAHNLYLNGELITELVIPEGVTSIGYDAFYGCSSLTAITIPEGVTSIGGYAFYGCSSLTAITIPEGVTSIGFSAFSNCSSLITILLPKSVEYVDSKAFAGCSELTDVYCYAEMVPSTETNAFDGSYIEYATLHVPAGAIESYKATAPWSSFGTIVSLTNEKVTSITLNQSTATLTEGQTLTLIATIEPVYATDKTLIWSSTNPSVATVDNTGKVTAIAPDTATITATANDGSGVSAQCEVTVEAATYVSITVNQYESGTYCSEYALDFSNVEGLKAYAATGYNKKTKVVTLTRVMTTQPGEGLFIKGESGTYMVPIIEEADDNSLNMLVGTLTDTPVNAQSTDGLYANYKYTIKADESEPSFHQFADGSTLSAGKAYLQIPVAWLPATTEARSISLRFEEGEGTTDIENSEIKNQNSEFVYDLYGRRVDNPVKGGIYIVGGKKKVVK